MADAHKNFAYSTVATAPVPADSGTSLIVASGAGALFPAPPFNVTVWPASAQPLASNAEIVRVTDITGDTFTIVREQEGSAARAIIVGDQIAATITAKTLTDAEIGSIIDKTWAELKALADASSLAPGQLYRITDFRTRHLIPNTTDYNIGPTEPITVTAISVDELAVDAYSEAYPQDVIYYELADSSGSGGDRGRIYFRYDTSDDINVAVWEDWRTVKYRRWETFPGNNVFARLTDAPVDVDKPVLLFLSGNRIVTEEIEYTQPYIGQTIEVYGSTSNDGFYTVANVVGNTIYVEETIVEESAGNARVYYIYAPERAYLDNYMFANPPRNVRIEKALTALSNNVFIGFAYDSTIGAGSANNTVSSLIASEIGNDYRNNSGWVDGIATDGGCDINRSVIKESSMNNTYLTVNDSLIGTFVSGNVVESLNNCEICNYFTNNIIRGLSDSHIGTYVAGIEITGVPVYPVKKTMVDGLSTFERTVNISGLTTLDITENYSKFAGIIDLTSTNATESINLILNQPSRFDYELRPEIGLTLTINGTAFADIDSDGQILLNSATVNLIGSEMEYIIFRKEKIGRA